MPEGGPLSVATFEIIRKWSCQRHCFYAESWWRVTFLMQRDCKTVYGISMTRLNRWILRCINCFNRDCHTNSMLQVITEILKSEMEQRQMVALEKSTWLRPKFWTGSTVHGWTMEQWTWVIWHLTTSDKLGSKMYINFTFHIYLNLCKHLHISWFT